MPPKRGMVASGLFTAAVPILMKPPLSVGPCAVCQAEAGWLRGRKAKAAPMAARAIQETSLRNLSSVNERGDGRGLARPLPATEIRGMWKDAHYVRRSTTESGLLRGRLQDLSFS